MLKATLIILSVIASQANVSSLSFAVIDGARAELETLKQTVLGMILVAEGDLEDLKFDLHTYSNNSIKSATVSLENEQLTINEDLEAIKNLATTANVDISLCLNGTEDYLTDLPKQILSELEQCVSNELEEAAKILSGSEYLIDVTINRVNALEFALNLCDENSDECILPIVEKIILGTEQIPLEIKNEVFKTKNLFEEIKVLIEQCVDLQMSQYVATATTLLTIISSCVDTIIS